MGAGNVQSRRPTTVAVMAGGRGLRLWPRSTSAAPKQFHGFFGGPVLLQQSLALAGLVAPSEQTYVITAAEYGMVCRTIVGDQARIVTEPFGRDTAACVGLAALLAEADHPGAVLVLMPSDHWVGDFQSFARTLRTAADLAEREERLITVGVRPDRPETGYGYILAGEQGQGFRKGIGFREKPGREEAERLIAGGDVFWNAGIFVARATVFLRLIGQHLPGLGAALGRIAGALGTPQEAGVLTEEYGRLPSISFDHGVAERLGDFLVVPAEFPWDDLGSWPAFARLLPADADGNVTAGQVLVWGAQRCLADTPDLRTVLLGVSDLIVVQEGDHLLITSPQRSQDLKQVAAALENRPAETAQHRSWGWERTWADTGTYRARILQVRAGEVLTLTGVPGRQETLYIDRGEGEAVVGEGRQRIAAGVSVQVEPDCTCQIFARTSVRILAVSGNLAAESPP